MRTKFTWLIFMLRHEFVCSNLVTFLQHILKGYNLVYNMQLQLPFKIISEKKMQLKIV